VPLSQWPLKTKTLKPMILPKNGGVVVIDDQPKEALPIIRALSKKGIPTTYYQGNQESDMPDEPMQIVRLIFLDLQLIESNDEHQIAKSIVNILQKIISKENGPFILVIWSKNSAKYSARVQQEINQYPNLRPSSVIEFNKRDCLEEKIINSVDQEQITKKVLSSLTGRLDKDDENAIKEAVMNALSDEFQTEFVVKQNAMEIIERHIKEGLESAGVFHLFVIWENLIHQSGGLTVQAISDTIETTNLWEQNMRDIIKRLAKARTGQNEITDAAALEAALTTFTYSFSEELESKIRDYNFPDYIQLKSQFLIAGYSGTEQISIEQYDDGGKPKLRLVKADTELKKNIGFYKLGTISNGLNEPDLSVVNKLTQTYLNIPTIINTKLHTELNPTKELIPGNVYEIEVSDKEIKKQYLSTYFDKLDDDLTKYKFIELEVSPICDYAQTKWKKSRLVSGVVYSEDCPKAKSKIDHLYQVHPSIQIQEKPMKMIFDYHLFKSLDTDIVEKREIWFRLKRELLLDIIANLSGHVNRPGISFMV
jgi:hypothetical protein